MDDQVIFTIGFELVKPLYLYIIWFPKIPLASLLEKEQSNQI
jgi:hypothetical protein